MADTVREKKAAPLTNRAIAQVFSDIATLLQAKGESVFKTRAYSRAADAIDNLHYDLADAEDDEERIRAIPGFGDAIVSKTLELIRTRRLEYFDKLKAEMPEGILALSQVPGIGPKTAMRAAEQLGIKSTQELAASIESGQFATLPRMSEKSAQNILRHLNARISMGERVAIGDALPEAEFAISELLKACPEVRNLEYAGSLRRHRETIGDIDLLCSADNPEKVTAAFADLPMVRDVIGQGKTKAMVIVESGIQIDLRVVPDEAFAATLLYFTGSKEHGIRLRDRANKIGLSLNEYGMKNIETDEVEAFKSEADIYAKLGLPYIAPELREDSGEFEAAEKGELPDLIELSDVKGDLHSHTDWTDGRSPLEEMVEAAQKAGLEYLVITDHSKSATVANGLSVERLREHNEAVKALDKKVGGIHLMLGTEMDILTDGSLDYPDDVLADLDIVLGSIHSGMEQDRATMTARIIKAMESEHLDVIAHLTTRLIGARAPVDVDFDAICEAAVRTGTLLEINTSTKRLDLKDTHIRRARDMGVLFTLGSDSHRTRQFDDIRYGVGMARRGWCEPWRIVNTLPYELFKELTVTPKGERYAFIKKYAIDS